MTEPFEITVFYKDENISLHARWEPYRYTHRFIVSISGRDVVFEPDEERNYRALVDAGYITGKEPDIALLKAIAETIEEIVR